ncbi:MAG: HIT domain-containing protein [Methylococcaceae bacterium]|nr:HIT domain-containing protein [Methylococcaceae bacterium]
MTNSFQLHPRLAQDCIVLGRFELCQILLMNDAHYPWFILVPERPGISEIYQLDSTERQQLSKESAFLAATLARHYHADKMNIAAIGNIVPQLHIHHIVRYQTDAAWPAPVWGKFAALPYAPEQLADTTVTIQQLLKLSA